MNDLPDSEKLRSSLRPSPLSTLTTPTPQVDVKSWDIAYLATIGLDIGMPEPFQKHLVDRVQMSGASVTWDFLESGHFVHCSHADEVAKLIKGIVS